MRLGRLMGVFVPSLFFLPMATPVLIGAAQSMQSSWQAVGQIGGPTQAVAVQGSYAYVGVGLRLVVLDVSNPAALREVGATTAFPYFVEDVAIGGTLAYVAAGGGGLRVVDISDPAHLNEVGHWTSPGYAEGVAVAGSVVYLADGPYGLRVIDVRNPAQPTEVGSAYSVNYAFKVAVNGHYAYVAAAGGGLLIADVTDPTHPVEVGSLDTPGYAYGVAAADANVYVADGWEGVRIINVSDAAHPVEIGSYKTPGWAFEVAIASTLAYVADGPRGLRVLDVSDRGHPAEIGSYEVAGGHGGHVAVLGNIAYVADRNWGLRAVSISESSHPAQVDIYAPLGFADAVAVAGNHAYVAAGVYGLSIVDISDPAHSRQVGVYDTQSYASSVAVVGDYAYVATTRPPSDGQGLHVVDIRDPAHPVRAGFFSDHTGAYRDMAVAGGIAYVANEEGLLLIDLTSPSAPKQVGTITLKEPHGSQITGPTATDGVAVSGTLAYVVAASGGLKIVDVSQPANPKLISSFLWSHASGQDVVVSQGLAYVADYFGLTIVDVSNPRQPVWLGFFQTPGFAAESVTLAGKQVLVADGGAGLTAVDVSDPKTPALAGSYNTAGYAQEVAVRGDYAFVADQNGGLVVLQKIPAASSQDARRPIFLRSSQLAPMPNYSYQHAAVPRHTGAVGRQVREAGKPSPPAVGVPAGMATTCTVNQTSDKGPGTLRACLESAVSGSVITFDPSIFPPSHPATIAPTTQLPWLSQGHITVDASNAGVVLDGSSTPAFTNGLVITSNSNIIKGLQIVRFPAHGVSLQNGAKDNLIGGNRLRGTGPLGEGNLISGNAWVGINITDEETAGNIVIGNLIGTDVSGKTAWANQDHGVFVLFSPNNRIGSSSPEERNIISGNGGAGVALQGFEAAGNVVIGNYVGVDGSGNKALSNGQQGVALEMGANQCRLERNVIVASPAYAVIINDWGSSYNSLVGNLIGTDASGQAALVGASDILSVSPGFNRIGGTAAEERNIIAGTVVFGRGGGPGNLLLGNYIGTDISGTKGLAKGFAGVNIGNGSQRPFIGGTTAGERNVISGNAGNGIALGRAVDYVFIGGNYIGTDPNGTSALGNQGTGIVIASGERNVIQGNGIAYNSREGVNLAENPRNTMRRNSIHSNASRGIVIVAADKKALSAPLIIAVTASSVSGTACPGCTIEIFSDAEDEGRDYEGTAIADASGTFTFNKGSSLVGPNITATATDRDGNTSEFSRPSEVPGGGLPGKATLLSPSGTISTVTPTYTWNAVRNATWYQLWVNDNVASPRIQTWYTSTQAGCGSGTGTCSVTPSTALASGRAQWWIQTWNDAGYGPWSDAMSFTITGGVPGKASLISPSGTVSTTTPTYIWNAVASATWYQLWVNDSSTSTGKIITWYTAAQAGCASGTGTCSVTPTTPLASGSAQWWIQTWNNYGYGPWSDGMTFNVGVAGPPETAGLVSPTGSITTTILTHM